MVVRRFEDLDVWKLADELKKEVYALLDRSEAPKDRRFCEQIRDSAASAPANLAEGFGYYRHPEFAKHTRIAKSSLMETQNHLRDGVDRRFWSAQQADRLLLLADRAIGKCVRLLAHLESSDAPGTERTSRPKTVVHSQIGNVLLASTRRATTHHPTTQHATTQHPTKRHASTRHASTRTSTRHRAPRHPAQRHPVAFYNRHASTRHASTRNQAPAPSTKHQARGTRWPSITGTRAPGTRAPGTRHRHPALSTKHAAPGGLP